MFSGVTAGLGCVKAVEKKGRAIRLTVECPKSLLKNITRGGSVCVSGVCLSVTGRQGSRLSFDVVSETLRRSTVGRLKQGDAVNLERPLRYGARIEGHCVQGHVEAVGRIDQIRREGRQVSFRIRFPKRLQAYLLEKGSVAVDGVSLTVGRVGEGTFWVHCIPITLQETTWGLRRLGDPVNLESDWLIKSLQQRKMRRLIDKASSRG